MQPLIQALRLATGNWTALKAASTLDSNSATRVLSKVDTRAAINDRRPAPQTKAKVYWVYILRCPA